REVRALAGDDAIRGHRGRVEARETRLVGGGPMHGHVAVVPARAVGGRRRRAAQGRRRLVYVDVRETRGGGVARGVGGRATRTLGRPLTERLGRRAARDAGEAVAAGELDRYVVVVPAEAIGRAVRGRADCWGRLV